MRLESCKHLEDVAKYPSTMWLQYVALLFALLVAKDKPMKTMLLEIEDGLYDQVMAFLGQLPAGQARISNFPENLEQKNREVNSPVDLSGSGFSRLGDKKEKTDNAADLSWEEVTAHILAKNAERYERLS